ncbi:MAG: hypothetical protein OZ948_14290 [Deltaproteobacteria bacterium]|nr:hypothetical protein [Deltaproteobacteria bacterium]
MNEPEPGEPFHSRTVYRLISAALGVSLTSIGIGGLLLGSGYTMFRIAASLAFIVLGLESIWSACAGRESWLSRIGPVA